MNKKHLKILLRIVLFTALFTGYFVISTRSYGFTTSDKRSTIYYVTPDATSDSQGNGSKAHPFTSLKMAVSRLKKGDTLYLRGGVYGETLSLSHLKGDSENYIRILAAPGETPILDGSKKKSPTMISIDTCSYLQVSGLEIQNANGQDACGIYVASGSSHLILDKNYLHDIRVPHPKKFDHCANGILLMGDSSSKKLNDVLISDNTIENCATGWSECISVVGNVENICVISNTISNTGNIGIDFAGNYGYCSDPSKDFPRHCIASKNHISNCVSPYATSYGLYVDGGQDIKLLENTITHCSGGIEIGAEQPQKSSKYATSDIYVSKNTITHCKEAAIAIGGYEKELGMVKKVTLEQNLCRNNGSKKGAILILSKCHHITIKNNSFVNTSGNAVIVSSEMKKPYTRKINFDGNTYGNGKPATQTSFCFLGKNYTSYPVWAAKVGEKNGIYSYKE